MLAALPGRPRLFAVEEAAGSSDRDRKVSNEEGQALADENGIKFLECSAKTGANVAGVLLPLMVELCTERALAAAALLPPSRENRRAGATATDGCWGWVAPARSRGGCLVS